MSELNTKEEWAAFRKNLESQRKIDDEGFMDRCLGNAIRVKSFNN